MPHEEIDISFFSLSLKFYFIWGRGLQGQRVNTKGGEMNGIEKQDVFLRRVREKGTLGHRHA